MQSPIASMAAPVVLAVAAFVHPSQLQGQATAGRPVSPAAARLRVVPLQTAFLDAATIKRTLAARSQPGGRKP
jgi:hypothetical protein